jgi:DMSO/TMAO reductase YedYZ molybdopterin-dependent catalytic subunit
MKLIPAVALAIAGGAWWLLGRTESETTVVSQTTPATATTSPAFEFPVTWNGIHLLPTIINSNDYRLKLDGDVSNPLELKLEELYAMTGVKKTIPIHCVERWAAEVPWEGIPLSYLLKQAGSSPESLAHVTIRDITGWYSTTLSSDEAANLGYMIALKVAGAPLTVDHGYPARLVAPSRPGYDWVKYISRITCTRR